MNNIYWVAAIAVIIICLYRNGKRKQLQMKHINDKVLAEVNNGEVIGRIIYHGGMPQMPKPAPLVIGVLPLSLLLWNDRGEKTSVDFDHWLKCEKLTMETRPDTRGLLVTLLGPLIFLFARHKARYFIVIKYLDCNEEENNILLECGQEANQQHIYGILYDRWQRISKQGQLERSSYNVSGKIQRLVTC